MYFLNLLNSFPDFSVGNPEKPSGASVLFMHIYSTPPMPAASTLRESVASYRQNSLGNIYSTAI